MKILLSPAKSLDYTSKMPTERATQPLFQKESVKLIEVLRDRSPEDLGSLMSISSKLADLNHERFQQYSTTFDASNSRPAIYAFAGDVYTGLDAYTLDVNLLDKAQDSVRILSGLYGFLRPLDLLQPYRLEMGTKLETSKAQNLYGFWGDQLTRAINEEINNELELVINLASQEYFKVIDSQQLSGTLVSPVFKDFKNGKLKIIAFFAKKARGMMTRFLLENEIIELEDLLNFNSDNYRYSEAETQDPQQPVFVR
ncbi:MAG: peroxide stress protein YaaA [Nonlabens sp.]